MPGPVAILWLAFCGPATPVYVAPVPRTPSSAHGCLHTATQLFSVFYFSLTVAFLVSVKWYIVVLSIFQLQLTYNILLVSGVQRGG